ncbi:MAG TPA: SUF system Fe-S cluster assembly protein [Vicinamibacterales bacterium]|jgi:FeS assembly SUF system protein
MSSPQNDAADSTRILPVIPDSPEPAQSQSGANRPPITPDPLNTLKLKPEIIQALSTIFDPEIPVNIYELGLIYDILVDHEGSVEIRMTLTSPGCPAAQVLPVQTDQRVRGIPGVKDVHVEVVWDPPWTKDRMSEAAKLQLGIF